MLLFIEDDYFGPLITPEIAAALSEISPHVQWRLAAARNWSKPGSRLFRLGPAETQPFRDGHLA
jgi:hypothetical protein